jgi:putative heme-binding domain-containing protein
MAVRWLQNLDSPDNHTFLSETARGSDAKLQIEAIRRLGESTSAEAATILLSIGKDRTQQSTIRTEAIASLAGKPDLSLVALLNDPDPSVRLETARALRRLAGNATVHEAARRKLAAISDDEPERRLRSQLEFLVAPERISRPGSVRSWQTLLEKGGDPEAGERVFFSANSTCVQCHSIHGRGINLGSGSTAGFIAMPFGPDLSVIARTANRDALIRTIVRPGEFIAPEYQGWFVEMKNGETIVGREIDQERTSIQLITLDGHEHDFPREDIASWGALKQSLMPEELPKSMAIEEFRDLIAFLCSLK